MWDEMDIEELATQGHEVLSEALLECTLAERECLRQLDLEKMLVWTERRRAITQQVIALARQESASDEAYLYYERAQSIARENFDILQGAHRSVKTVLDGISRADDARYSASGAVSNAAAIQVPRNVLLWKG